MNTTDEQTTPFDELADDLDTRLEALTDKYDEDPGLEVIEADEAARDIITQMLQQLAGRENIRILRDFYVEEYRSALYSTIWYWTHTDEDGSREEIAEDPHGWISALNNRRRWPEKIERFRDAFINARFHNDDAALCDAFEFLAGFVETDFQNYLGRV
jgi:hypothetical protein